VTYVIKFFYICRTCCKSVNTIFYVHNNVLVLHKTQLLIIPHWYALQNVNEFHNTFAKYSTVDAGVNAFWKNGTCVVRSALPRSNRFQCLGKWGDVEINYKQSLLFNRKLQSRCQLVNVSEQYVSNEEYGIFVPFSCLTFFNFRPSVENGSETLLWMGWNCLNTI